MLQSCCSINTKLTLFCTVKFIIHCLSYGNVNKKLETGLFEMQEAAILNFEVTVSTGQVFIVSLEFCYIIFIY